MRVRVKICGIVDAAGLEAAVEAGADAVGFVFYGGSPRNLCVERAAALARRVPLGVARVAVFHHPMRALVERVYAAVEPDWIQTEPAAALDDGPWHWLPVFHDGEMLAADVDTRPRDPVVLIEGPGRGGRGVAADWSRVAEIARRRRVALGGGLRPDNVADAIRRVRPYAVDVSSGVESAPGVKDPARICAFAAAVRAASNPNDDTEDAA